MRLVSGGLLASVVLVLITFFFKNETLVPFPKAPAGLLPEQYGFPLAFRETWIWMDAGGAHFHWRFFLLDVFILFPFVVLPFYWLARAGGFQNEEA